MKELYKIWHIGKHTYPLENILSVLIHDREDVISIDYNKLQKVCNRLNVCRDDDEHYEVRMASLLIDQGDNELQIIEKVNKVLEEYGLEFVHVTEGDGVELFVLKGIGYGRER